MKVSTASFTSRTLGERQYSALFRTGSDKLNVQHYLADSVLAHHWI